MKNIMRKISSTVAMIAILLGLGVAPINTELALAAQDCDANAVIYCGVNSKADLINKMNKGTGKPNQSSTELKDLFGYYGINTVNINDAHLGYVTKDNKVVLNNKTVATNVYSMGRSYMTGSTRVSRFSYPIYLRHPSVSFRSSSIPAYVKMNPNGTMAWAVITSCGNIVPGTKYVEPTYKLTTWKYEDADRDGKKDSNEPMLSGWVFDISGPNGYKNTITTSSNGGLTLTNLKAGTYTITERQKSGWQSTTGLTQRVTIKNSNQSVYFGNARIVQIQQTISLRIAKFNDLNGDKTRNANEEMLAGWQFRVSGPNGYFTIVTTNSDGIAELNGLKTGNYTVTEILKDGWENTTGLTVSKNVTTNTETQVFVFGNRAVEEVVITGGGEVLPTLPKSGPAQAAAIAFGSLSVSGAALAWIRSRKRLLSSFIK